MIWIGLAVGMGMGFLFGWIAAMKNQSRYLDELCDCGRQRGVHGCGKQFVIR